MRFGRSPSGILACLPKGKKGGSKAELLKISRKADRIAPSALSGVKSRAFENQPQADRLAPLNPIF